MRLVKKQQYTGHRAAIYKMVVDRGQLLSVGGDGFVVEWPIGTEVSDGRVVAQVDAKVFSLAVLQDGWMVLGDLYGHVYWVDTKAGQTRRNVQNHKGAVYDLAMINGSVYSTSADGYLTRWDTEHMFPSESMLITTEGLRTMLMTEYGLLVGTSSNEIVCIDLDKWKITARWPAHSNSVFTLALSGNRLLSGGRDAHLKVWQAGEWQPLKSLEAHWFTINDLLVIKDQELLVTASRDKSIRLWDLETLTPLVTKGLQQGGHVNSVNTLAYHDGVIYSAGDDRTIMAWELKP